MTDRVSIAPIVRLDRGRARTDQDLVAVEAPLTIDLAQPTRATPLPLGVVMRTPGEDVDLVTGLLFAEGVIRLAADILDVNEIAGASGPDDAAGDRIVVTLAAAIDLDAVPARALAATSACGLCGRVRISATAHRSIETTPWRLSSSAVLSIPASLRQRQRVFAETGGLHAAALCDAAGHAWLVREDVGRHNAVDKIVGAALRAGRVPLHGAILGLSGRIGFEIVQKAAAAGLRVVVAVGAPSSLAVEAARAADLTLIGFAREGRFNVYTGPDRIAADHSG